MHIRFDSTISLGNVLTAITFLIAAVVGWRDFNWRIRNLEMWKSAHEHTTEQQQLSMTILRDNVTKLTALAMGQDRRLILLEDRSEDRMRRTQ